MKQATSAVPVSEAFAGAVLRLRARDFANPTLLAALEQTPRAAFVDAMDEDYAYYNRAVPIGCGEYIERLDEQIAAIAALELEKNHRVLEIGTGSGFSAALMARLVERVTTIERYKTLVTKAQKHFEHLQLANIIIIHSGDAHHGLPTHYGSFDRIIIWSACEVPPPIFSNRLVSGGVMIVPVGKADETQIMTKVSKTGSRLTLTPLFPVRYQPLLSGLAQKL